jgi:hypothetical protein
MHMLINAVVLSLTLPADPLDIARVVPTCSAQLDGRMLLTQVEFADGYVVEGPWRVLHTRNRTSDSGAAERVMAAVLDRIVERDALTGERRTTPFGQGVAVTFEGASQDDVLRRAADLWCATVMRLGKNPSSWFGSRPGPLRLATARGGTEPERAA